MGETIRWGILGPGNIAAKFAQDLALVPEGTLMAVASRDGEKAQAFARAYGATKAYTGYNALLADPGVDVVYIASPHSLHEAHTLAALEAGKHVLCEKPLGMNAAQVLRMQALAKAKGRFLMEALWSRFNPSIREVLDIARGGGIGTLSYLRADFAFPALERDPSGRLLNPSLGGGSLLDIGIYPVFLAYLLLGSPTDLRVLAHFHETGVEKQIGILLDYPDAIALLYSGFTSRTEMRAELSGSRGNLFLRSRWHQAGGYELDADGEVRVISHPLKGNGYAYEIEEVHHCLRQGATQSRLWSWEDSASLHRLLDRIRREAGIAFPGETE